MAWFTVSRLSENGSSSVTVRTENTNGNAVAFPQFVEAELGRADHFEELAVHAAGGVEEQDEIERLLLRN